MERDEKRGRSSIHVRGRMARPGIEVTSGRRPQNMKKVVNPLELSINIVG